MKFAKLVKKKLKNNNGESLSEVLIAVLISTLGMVLLAGMITSSVNIVTKNKTAFDSYVTAENDLVDPENKTDDTTIIVSSGTITFSEKLTAATPENMSVNVSAYSATLGNKKIYTYKK